MKLKPKKCRLLRRKVNYLTQKELRQFLGLASYYRRFVKGFASIAAPLNHLLEKGKPWEWTKVCEHAFSSLKKMLTTSPILAYPDFEIEFTVDCDASGDGLGAVLSQCIGGGENVISYASRSLTKPEKKYCATRKEMLALVWRLVNSVHIFWGDHLQYGLTTVLFSGSTHSRNQKDKWPGGWNRLQNTNSQSNIVPGRSILMLMLCLAYPARMPLQSMPTAYLWTHG